MIVENWVVHKLSDLFRCQETLNNTEDKCAFVPTPSHDQIIQSELKAQGQWFSAIASLEAILLSTFHCSLLDESVSYGLILSGPTPVLSHPQLLPRFQTGVFTPKAFKHIALMPCQSSSKSYDQPADSNLVELPLYPQDPLAKEQFCLVLTAHFGFLMVVGEDEQGLCRFDFSFEPQIIQQGWMALRSRLLLLKHPHLAQLEALARYLTPPVPDYKLVMDFSRNLLKNLPPLRSPEAKKNGESEPQGDKIVPVIPVKTPPSEKFTESHHSCDIELLQALTHEIRTPLSTIRTMTRLLLKRAKLTPEMSKCLEVIDQECTEQINRMELIFRAAEWGSTAKEKSVQLIPISLEQVLHNSIPCWQKQAQRRNVSLDVVLPQTLPQVVSDPAMLEQMLTGLIEKCTRTVPQGGQIRVKVTTAGHQLKLQFHSQSNYQNNPFKALGQLLMFQPATGSLSLNLDVTKNLFHALGGKLTVRQRPEDGEVLTIFLPLGSNRR
jgi:hypothetical protein